MENDQPELVAEPIHGQTTEQAQLAEAFEATVATFNEGHVIRLADLLPFEWDQVCFFGMGATSAYINETIGIEWLTESDVVEEDRQLFVLIQGDQVVQKLVFSPGYVYVPTVLETRMGVCVTRSAAVMTARTFTSGGRPRVSLRLDLAE
ncbi:MAG: hypothetical protein MUF87_21435 [Anaerolineae bacterium]|nr:hypothetical protein [Anaerolineae bacterium]